MNNTSKNRLLQCAAAFCWFACLQTLCANELRATWLARDSLTSKAALAQAMNTIASNNFNTVFVNAWSRGYPLWKSQTFSNETGLNIDPGYVGRDILAEAVAEGHRNGLHVFAWFEYGFVGGYSGYLPGSSGKGKIFDTHPDWVSAKNDGTQIDGSSFYWMTQVRPDVQQFLINLARETVANYDLDGIEFDRIRYSSLAYGYDDFTQSLFQNENGVAPPAQTDEAAWIRWRADKLNQFVADACDELKSLNPQFLISSAPSAYGSSSYTAYSSFCQDWVWWINSNKVDQVEVQSYFSTANAFSNVLNFIATQVSDKQKVFPSFALNPNSVYLDPAEVVKFPAVTRAQGFGGNAIWYYVPLNTSNYFTALRTHVYETNTPPPERSSDWRDHRSITLISDSTNAVRTGSWPPSGFAGYSGPSCYAQTGALATIDYFFEAPVAGKYEVYAHTVSAASRTTAAEHRVFDSAGNTFTNFINQNNANNAGWSKIGDYLLEAGRHRVVQLSNRGLTGSQLVSGDAMMIILNRRLSAPLKLIPPSNRTNAEPFRYSITGASGQKINIQSSSNLLDWNSLSTVTLTNSTSGFSEPFSNGPKTFRARLAP